MSSATSGAILPATATPFATVLSGEMQQTWRLDMLRALRTAGRARAASNRCWSREVRDPTAQASNGARKPCDSRPRGASKPRPGNCWRPAGIRALADLGVTLHVPPGHRLLAALGADRAPSAWLEPLAAARYLHRAAGRDRGIPRRRRAPPLIVAGMCVAAGAPRAARAHLVVPEPADRHGDCACGSGRPLSGPGRELWRNIAFALVGVALDPIHAVPGTHGIFSAARAGRHRRCRWDPAAAGAMDDAERSARLTRCTQQSGERARGSGGRCRGCASDSAAATSEPVAASPPPAPARRPLLCAGHGPAKRTRRARMELRRASPGLEWAGRTGAISAARRAAPVRRQCLASARVRCLLVLLFVLLLREVL